MIHRDLKPGNVMITPDDKVKILDFGLAKALAANSSQPDATHSPTITEAMTRPGVILGTAAYMSPEQAKGKAIDKRSDIWAFGCILYECLAGKPAFGAETVSETIATILRGEPEWQALPHITPPGIKVLLGRCLQKDPRERLHDIADARIEIQESAARGAGSAAAAPAEMRSSILRPALGAAVMLLAGILIGRLLTSRPQIPSPASLVTSTIKVEPGHWLDGLRSDYELQRPSRNAMVISRDGRFVIYSAIGENPGPQAKSRLFLRRMDQSEAKAINGTEGVSIPSCRPTTTGSVIGQRAS